MTLVNTRAAFEKAVTDAVAAADNTVEMVYDNVTGFLVNEGDSEGWIEKLSTLVNDEDLRKKFGTAGKNLVIEKFNWDKLANEFLEIISKQLNQK